MGKKKLVSGVTQHRALANTILTLRHGSAQLRDRLYVWASYKDISRLTKVTPAPAAKVVQAHEEKESLPDVDLLKLFTRKNTATLTQQQIDFLANERTLTAWRDRSLR